MVVYLETGRLQRLGNAGWPVSTDKHNVTISIHFSSEKYKLSYSYARRQSRNTGKELEDFIFTRQSSAMACNRRYTRPEV